MAINSDEFDKPMPGGKDWPNPSPLSEYQALAERLKIAKTEAEEDAIMELMDPLWWKLTEEQRTYIRKRNHG